MTRRTAWILFLLAATLPWGILLATNSAMGTPTEARLAAQCTRACHSHGCTHDPVLPDAIASDTGWFGQAITGLYRAGSLTGLSAAEGYGAANLALFCALWPGGMLALVGVGLRQRVVLAERRSP